ncbi:hypothetical protein J2S30_001547 [Herbaspirillum rubrisubalbicans]|nr:hypothetical protein [Herbaspirillum rubrisubalbicans]
MGRAGIDDTDLGIFNQRHRFAGGGVGQAQQGDVGAVDGFGAAPRILALGWRQGQHAQVGATAQALVDLQTGGALVAVDEDEGKSAHAVLQCRKGCADESGGVDQ